MPAPWSETSLDGEPRFVVGFRKGSGLINCYRVDIHEDTFREFREIARGAIARIPSLTRRPYDYFGALEEDEYFALDIRRIPKRPIRTARKKSTLKPAAQVEMGLDRSQQPSTPGAEEAAATLRMVAQTDEHRFLTADELRGGLNLNLYMICFPIDSGFLAFIRRTGPHRSLAPGLRYFQYGDTLKRMRQPDFVLDNRVDMIVGPDEIAVFSDTVVQVLFRDVRLVMGSVDNNVQRLGSAFSEYLPLSSEGVEALRRFANRGPRNAKRLHDLANQRLADLTLGPAAISEDLVSHQLDHLVVDGELALSDESIPSYVDYLEGRLFHDDHTREPRRADRFSSRRPG